MNISPIAIPYAKALFDLAIERNELEPVMKDMAVIASVCSTSNDFLLMLRSPIIHPDKKRKIIQEVLKGAISEITFTFLTIIIRKRREKYLPDIAQAFVDLYKEHKGILVTHVRTAVPVTPEIRQQIINVMKNYTGLQIELEEEVRKDMIGGFILNWKGKQYDASVLNQINKLRKDVARINLFVKKL